MIDLEAIDVEIDGIDRRDHPDYCDAYVARAWFKGSGNPLSESELEWVNEQRDFVHKKVFERIY